VNKENNSKSFISFLNIPLRLRNTVGAIVTMTVVEYCSLIPAVIFEIRPNLRKYLKASSRIKRLKVFKKFCKIMFYDTCFNLSIKIMF